LRVRLSDPAAATPKEKWLSMGTTAGSNVVETVPLCANEKPQRHTRSANKFFMRSEFFYLPVKANVVTIVAPVCTTGGATASATRAHVGSGLVAFAKLAIT
jgi:hypothetical protein